jgi:hypothetical protein
MKNLTRLTQNKALNETLFAIADNAALRSAGVPREQAERITLSGNFHELKRSRSLCCFAPIEDGYCSYCGIETDNLL